MEIKDLWKKNALVDEKEYLSMYKESLENNENYLHQYTETLVENKLDKQEKYFGRTKYMMPVIFESPSCKPGELVNVKITSYNQNNLFGFHTINKVKAA